STWGDGPWQDEPDKKQWQDEATGLPCLAVRDPGGHWCGYVGVAPDHPWHGKDYDSCGMLEAHGGITFASGCADQSEGRWRQMRGLAEEYRREARTYPRGAAAQWLTEWLPVLNDYPAWREHVAATSVCHVADAGEPDHVWWFGFDCAHCDDLSPKYSRDYGL